MTDDTGSARALAAINVSVLDLLSRIEAMTASVWSSGLVVPCLRASGFPFTAPVPR